MSSSEERNAERDRRDQEMVERERVVGAAQERAPALLPGRVGFAVSALLEALRPVRHADGDMSYPVAGRSSQAIEELARAVLDLDTFSEGVRRFPRRAGLTYDGVFDLIDAELYVGTDETGPTYRYVGGVGEATDRVWALLAPLEEVPE